MFRALIAWMMLVLSLLTIDAVAQSLSGDAAIGVWPWLVGNIDSSTPAIVAQAQASGLDTIYLHLFRTTGTGVGTLHCLDQAGNWNASFGPTDPDVTLTSFLAQAHAAGLQVVGVVNCFLAGAPLPGSAAHEALLLNVIDYLVNNFGPSGDPIYRLDGIALDRVRFYDGTANPHAAVTSFVAQVRERLGLVPLHGFLMANLYSFDGPTYNAQFNSYAATMSTLQGQFGQHWENLASLMNVFLPMAYIAEGGVYGSNTSQMQAYVQATAAYARQAQLNAGVSSLRVLPAVRAWTDTTGTTTAASLDASILGALQGGADGFMPFRYFTMSGQTSWWNVVTSRSQPGSGFPLANLTQPSEIGLTLNLNASTSTSSAGAANLLARFDLNDDGIADTPWSLTKTHGFLSPGAGQHRVSVQVRDAFGREAVRKRRVTQSASSLSLLGAPISLSQGGSRSLALLAGPGGASRVALLALSATGTSPGFPLGPNLNLPLVFDGLSEVCLQLANSIYLPGFLSVLPANGVGVASVVLPTGALPPSIAPSTWWIAGAILNSQSTAFASVTQAVAFSILP